MLIKTRILYLAIFRLVSALSRPKKRVALPQKILLACNITTYYCDVALRPRFHAYVVLLCIQSNYANALFFMVYTIHVTFRNRLYTSDHTR